MLPLHEERIHVKKAVTIVFLSMVIVTALFFAVTFYYKMIRRYSINNKENYIFAIASRSQTATKLSNQLLAELLNLSADRPVNIYHFDCKTWQKALKAFPVFASVTVKRYPPSVIFVDYRLRKPRFLVGDLENIAIDDEGVFFPLVPFYPRLQLPNLYLSRKFSLSTKDKQLTLAKEIQNLFQTTVITGNLKLVSIDLHAAHAASSKEITLTLEGKDQYLLRLSSSSWQDGLRRFFYLYTDLIEEGRVQSQSPKETSVLPSIIVDLRLPKMAFVR